MNWPRRGNEWDVFDVDGSGVLEIERCDEACHDMPETALWDDGDAAGFAFSTASRPPDDCPPDVTAECRAAVREIVASWSLKGDGEPRWKRYDCTLLRDGTQLVTLAGHRAGRLSLGEVRDFTTRVVQLLNAAESAALTACPHCDHPGCPDRDPSGCETCDDCEAGREMDRLESGE